MAVELKNRTRMEIPYVDLAAQHAPLKSELLDAVASVIDTGQFIGGPQIEEFEQRFAALCGVHFAIGVSSGTDALILALRAVGIGPGDEVITAPNSFVASTSCIRLLGARPVFVDVRDDFTLDVDQVASAVTPRTRAVLPVHLTGRPCELDTLSEIATRHGLRVIEDCAQAVLAEYKGRSVGSFGVAGCFSLHPLKTLNACGDAGVITTNDEELAERLAVLRNIGLRARNECVAWSGNSRLDTVQAAMLLVKLARLTQWTDRRRENARLYRERLADVPEVRVPRDAPHVKAVYHTFVIEADDRDTLRRFLSERGIGSAVHYPVPIHLSPIGRELGYGPGSFPVAERHAARILSLPVYPELTETQIGRVCDTVRAFYGRA